MINDGFVGSSTVPTVAVDVGFGAVAEGFGSYFVTPNTTNGGRYSTGHSPGTGSVGAFNFSDGNSFQFEVSDGSGTAGNLDGWDLDLVHATGRGNSNPSLNFFAGATYTVEVDSWTAGGLDGGSLSAAQFNENTPYAWEFIDGSQAQINGDFSSTTFAVDPSLFKIATDTTKANFGTFSIQFRDTNGDTVPDSLFVVYTPKITGTTSGTVIEDGGVNNGTPGTPTASGLLVDNDVSTPAGSFMAVTTPAPSANHFGTYTMTDSGTWTYFLDNNNAAVQGLQIGQTTDRHVHRVDLRQHAASHHDHDRRRRRRAGRRARARTPARPSPPPA